MFVLTENIMKRPVYSHRQSLYTNIIYIFLNQQIPFNDFPCVIFNTFRSQDYLSFNVYLRKVKPKLSP